MTIQKESSGEVREALSKVELDVLGERIRRARTERKVSQKDLSDGLFTSAYLSSLELGKTRPTIHTLKSLAERLDKSLDYFVRQNSSLAPNLDEEYTRSLEIRFGLLSAQTHIAQGDKERAEKTLDQVQLHLSRLNLIDRTRYFYQRAKWLSLEPDADAVKALLSLDEARRVLSESPVDGTLEISVQIELESGHIKFNQKRVMPALGHYNSALNSLSYLKNPPAPNMKTQILTSIANCYLALNNWDKAVSALKEALEEAGSNLDLREQAVSYQKQAFAYREHGDFQLACLSLGRSLQIYEQEMDQVGLLATRNSLGQMYAQVGQYDSAEKHVQEALKMAHSLSLVDRCEEMNSLITMATVRHRQNKLTEANNLLEQAMALRLSCKDARTSGRLWRVAGEIAADMGQKDHAEDYYNRAVKTLENSKMFVELSNTYHSYGLQLRNWGYMDRAFELLDLAYRTREQSWTDKEQ